MSCITRAGCAGPAQSRPRKQRASLAAVLLLIVVPGCSEADSADRQAHDTQVQAIVAAAMDFAAETGEANKRQCVVRAVTQTSFERWRAHQRIGGEPTLGLADPKYYQWASTDPTNGAVRPEMKQALQEAIAQQGKRRLRELPMGWIDKRLKVVSDPVPDDDCPIHIFSEPSIAGGWAFIEDDIVCGPMCGGGKTLALRRAGENWVVAAVAPTWHVGFDRMLREPLPPPDSDQFIDL